ncbi:RHS repeat-associated core domain-containing protein (plasmid) [Aliiroseovarius crassostreae]|uniref:RHS repeat-associated core domain-containing protein n=1 Tax=Aliiroseovarius crassostreae TaxID=154981 RepID=UPI0021FDE21C|nr:RHS repeat-associated core domain-containing protein [Aliiroseovarius crassostreae]UWP94031.1 RHS repeat-associated core domain-containing protein [Aliiroseovarius crassostreae]
MEYFPFGETWVEEHSNRQRTPYLFTGKELDEDVQLYYFGARYYDPRTSVWQSPDPVLAGYLGGTLAGGVFAPRNLSLYSYAGGNPVRVTDPEGAFLDTILDIGFIIYDVGVLIHDEVTTGGENRTENLMALGADAAGALVPFATGGGAAVRGGVKLANRADDAADVGRAADRVDDAADIAQQGTRQVDEAVEPGGDKVYRALREGEDPSQGLRARKPGADTEVGSHVMGKRESDLISTTKDPERAMEKFNSGNGVVEIDLSKVNGEVIDASSGIGSGRVYSRTRSDSEVLIRDSGGEIPAIPPEAIRVID